MNFFKVQISRKTSFLGEIFIIFIIFQKTVVVVVVAGVVSRLVYTPGGGSGGGLGSCVSKGGRLSKEGRAAMCRATSTGRSQRSSTERPVGASPQSNR